MNPDDRTQILLEDIRAQFDILVEHIDGVELRLSKRMDRIEDRMDRMEAQMAQIVPLVRKHDREIKAIRTQLPN